jgi:alpha-methylacyl-CoA racemase
MVLADLGANVIRVDRKGEELAGAADDLLNRNKRSVSVNLKMSQGSACVRRLIERADVVTEGFRPGVMERLGLGPETFEESNPRLVYARMTGWGQDGPLAGSAGHDLNYIAITGALDAIGNKGQPPAIPLNLVGDFGGGSLYLAVGVLSAVFEAKLSGRGQIVDCAIVDGVMSLLAMHIGMSQSGIINGERGSNLIDGGAPFYGVYETADAKYITIGCVEPKFYRELLRRLELTDTIYEAQYDKTQWASLRERFAAIFRSRTRDQWCAMLEGTDVCFAPVLDIREAPNHRQNQARANIVNLQGFLNPALAPKFSRTPGGLGRPPAKPGAHSRQILFDCGFSESEVDGLEGLGAI